MVPSMFAALVLREMQEICFSFRLGLMVLIILVVTAVSAFVQARDYRQQLQDYSYQRSLHIEAANTHRMIINRSPSNLQFVFNGLSRFTPNECTLRLSAPPIMEQDVDLQPLTGLYATIDLSFLVGIVLGLFAILLSFDRVTGELEAGTLALTLSNPLPRNIILFAKWVSLTLVTLILIVITFGAYLAVGELTIGDILEFDSSDKESIIIIGLLSVILLSTYVSLGLLVSVLTKHSATALGVSLTFFFTLTFVLPSMVSNFPLLLAKRPSEQELETRIAELEAELASDYIEEHTSLSKKVLQEGIDSNTGAHLYSELEQRWVTTRRAKLKALHERYYQEKLDYESRVLNLLMLSPYAAYSLISMEVADTGVNSIRHFRRAVEEYDGIYLQTALLLKERAGLGFSAVNLAEAPTGIPDFRVHSTVLSERISRSVVFSVTLIGDSALLLLLALLAMSRIRPVG